MIYFEPQAGLCNRMRAIESAYQLAKDINTELCIVWLCNVDCNARYEELFQEIPDVKVINIPSILGIRTTVRVHKLVTYFIMKKCSKVIKYEEVKEPESIRKFVGDEDVYIQSWAVWYPYNLKKTLFKPAEEIEMKIDQKRKELGEECVGVHIRRTDHVDAIRNSSTDAFIVKMRQIIAECPQTNFFLASDSEKEKTQMKQLFGEKVIMNDKINLKRTSRKGMKNAVMDLFLLASCKRIIGSFGSSYSEMAAELGNIECKSV